LQLIHPGERLVEAATKRGPRSFAFPPLPRRNPRESAALSPFPSLAHYYRLRECGSGMPVKRNSYCVGGLWLRSVVETRMPCSPRDACIGQDEADQNNRRPNYGLDHHSQCGWQMTCRAYGPFPNGGVSAKDPFSQFHPLQRRPRLIFSSASRQFSGVPARSIPEDPGRRRGVAESESVYRCHHLCVPLGEFQLVRTGFHVCHGESCQMLFVSRHRCASAPAGLGFFFGSYSSGLGPAAALAASPSSCADM
jgi:hypothetical protein